jgi:hypothetical protein
VDCRQDLLVVAAGTSGGFARVCAQILLLPLVLDQFGAVCITAALCVAVAFA